MSNPNDRALQVRGEYPVQLAFPCGCTLLIGYSWSEPPPYEAQADSCNPKNCSACTERGGPTPRCRNDGLLQTKALTELVEMSRVKKNHGLRWKEPEEVPEREMEVEESA